LGDREPLPPAGDGPDSLSPCYGLLTALVLLKIVARWCNVIQHNFLQKWYNFTCLCT